MRNVPLFKKGFIREYLIREGYGSAEMVDEMIEKHGEQGVLVAAMRVETNLAASNKPQIEGE
jgi:hypothetical protein